MIGVGTGGIDNGAARDIAAIGFDANNATVFDDNPLGLRAGGEAHAACLGEGAIRHRQIGRLKVTIGRAPQHGLDAIEGHQRPFLARGIVVEKQDVAVILR